MFMVDLISLFFKLCIKLYTYFNLGWAVESKTTENKMFLSRILNITWINSTSGKNRDRKSLRSSCYGKCSPTATRVAFWLTQIMVFKALILRWAVARRNANRSARAMRNERTAVKFCNERRSHIGSRKW